MKIAISSDHGGFCLKQELIPFLECKGYQVLDLGTDSEDSVDYPIFGKRCAEAVRDGEAELGVVLCGTGIGVSIAANKVAGIRCALCINEYMARMARCHNDANVLAMGGRTTTPDVAKAILTAWLEAACEGGRHQRRIDMLNQM
ncbi:MAG: ribose 5-phosphate isomerase B, partial [Anaerovoracaceae bacterium]